MNHDLDVDALRLRFAVYMATGDIDDAVNLASHIPRLLDIIDTQEWMLKHLDRCGHFPKDLSALQLKRESAQ